MNPKNRSYLYILLISILYIPQTGYCQDYSINIIAHNFNIESTTYQGYQTNFTLPYKEVKKAWWKYIKAKTYIYNHKTYYELKIPSKKTEEEVILLSKLDHSSTKKITTLSIALSKNKELSAQKKKEYNESIKNLLKDFKISFYTHIIQRDIKEQEKKTRKISKEIAHISRKKNNGIELLKSRLMAETSTLEKLKHQLNQIK